ncbi:MAG TPA: branched-chain amino acid ABC transporter permease [Actinobacteria bacterium]|nr:branched-chain amino acid ABC transporter permease [Actinomycetota bacterium]
MRIGAIFVVAWGVIGALALGVAGEGLTGSAWKDLVVAGIAQGAMYGLIALGYSMVYGVLGFINFAHGEVFMAGAIVGFFVADRFFTTGMWESNFVVAILVVLVAAVATSTITAVLVERVAYRPLRNAPRLIPLITSIGVSFFLQNAVLGLVGPAVKTYPQPPAWLAAKVSILGLQIEGTKILVILIAVISMVALWLFVERTKTGRAMRAVAEDKEIAALMGIDVDRTIVTTFAVGGAMAGVAGIMWALIFRGVSFVTGFLPGIKAFTAAVLGGIGNLVGAMAGGLLLGLFEALGPNVVLRGLRWRIPLGAGLVLLVLGVLVGVLAWRRGRVAIASVAGALLLGGVAGVGGWSIVIPGLTQLKDVVAFSALVLVLIFKPTGVLGEQLAEEDRA